MVLCCACLCGQGYDGLLRSAAARTSAGLLRLLPFESTGGCRDQFLLSKSVVRAIAATLCHLLGTGETQPDWSTEQRQKAAYDLTSGLLSAGPSDIVPGVLVEGLLRDLSSRDLHPIAGALAGALDPLLDAIFEQDEALHRPSERLYLALNAGEIAEAACARVNGDRPGVGPGDCSSFERLLDALHLLLREPPTDALQEAPEIETPGAFGRPTLLHRLLDIPDPQGEFIIKVAGIWLSLLSWMEAADQRRSGAAGGRPSAARPSSSPQQPPQRLQTSLLSFLAFGHDNKTLLRRLWALGAGSAGLPLSAPARPRQGWDLGRAVGPLLDPDSPSSRCFTLFAMVHHHLLQVVDDLEFYEECGTGGVFSLDEHRAIAAVCNSLVVRGLLAQGRGQKASLPRSKRLPDALRAAAALQAALHDRDARRSFAGADLWLAPLIAAGMRPEHLVEPAVLRALDAQTDAAAEVRDDVTALDPSSDSQPVSTPAAALAALVRIAPQCVPFEARVELLRALIRADRARLRLDLPPAEGGPFPVEFRVRRSHLREDGAGALLRLGESVKRRLSVQFVDAHGLPEAGIDMGGLQKEFLERFVAAVTDLRCGLFAQSGAAVFPSPLAGELEGGWPALEAAGVALGKALHEGVLLEVPLAPFFVRRLQGRAVPSEELHSLDADLYRSLLQLKTLDAATVDALDLDFTVESDHFGRKTCEELVPGGARVAVTAANRLQYIHCLAHWHLSRRLGPSAEVFTRGLKKVGGC